MAAAGQHSKPGQYARAPFSWRSMSFTADLLEGLIMWSIVQQTKSCDSLCMAWLLRGCSQCRLSSKAPASPCRKGVRTQLHCATDPTAQGARVKSLRSIHQGLLHLYARDHLCSSGQFLPRVVPEHQDIHPSEWQLPGGRDSRVRPAQ